MADTRRRSLQRTQRKLSSAIGLIGAIVLLAAGAALAYFLDRPAAVGERADRIDFSALATVVSIDEYVASQVKGLRSEHKDDKLDPADAPAFLAATSLVKANFGVSAKEPTQELSALIAKYGARLQRHLETGWNEGAPARKDLAGLPGPNPQVQKATATALLPDALSVTRADSKRAGVRPAFGGKVSGSLSTGARLGGRTGISGLAP
jgi:hypothetical protein